MSTLPCTFLSFPLAPSHLIRTVRGCMLQIQICLLEKTKFGAFRSISSVDFYRGRYAVRCIRCAEGWVIIYLGS